MLSNYPDGLSDHTPDAPWNEPVTPDMDFDVTCSQSLSKTTVVTTHNYTPGASGVDYEQDIDGVMTVPWQDDPDTSDTNWSDEYHSNDHYTPLQLIGILKDNLLLELANAQNDIEGGTPEQATLAKRQMPRLKHLISECEGWIEDDIDYAEG